EAISGFTKALFEAVLIVLGGSFVSLGVRAGMGGALSVPLCLGIVFIAMEALGISLQRLSLGALIIALGPLVDDAMITVEMMITKIEEGMDKHHAATFAYTATAFPMLSGTLITVLGFLPIGFSQNNTGQYCFSLFEVIGVALIGSWIVAVLFAPVIGMAVLAAVMKNHWQEAGRGGGGAAGFAVEPAIRHATALADARRDARRLRAVDARDDRAAAAVLSIIGSDRAAADPEHAEKRLDLRDRDPGQGDRAAAR